MENYKLHPIIADNSRLLYSIAEVAAMTGLSKQFLRREKDRGNLVVKYFGRLPRVAKADLLAYIESGSGAATGAGK